MARLLFVLLSASVLLSSAQGSPTIPARPPTAATEETGFIGRPAPVADPRPDGTASVLGVPVPYATIQAAVNAASPGDTIQIAAGVYIENIIVTTPVLISGAGAGSTIVRPAISAPNPGGGSLPPGHSTLFLIQANDVTIEHLTADGDNPALTSGIIAGGVDIDARNGIITNHALGLYNNLTVRNVTVKNIYLRGIYASSGGTFHFHDCVVQNVQADPAGASIGIFNYGGSGVIERDTVSECSDAIAANHSKGTSFLDNVVTNSGSGVHTDNAGDAGGTPDLIDGNSVSNSTAGGYGVWVFVPYIAPTVQNNTVTNVDVGMGTFGGAFSPSPTVTVVFMNNTVDGANKANSIGFYATNSTFYWGVTSIAATLTGVHLFDNDCGMYIESAAGQTVTLDADSSVIASNTLIGADSGAVPAAWGGSDLPGTLVVDLTGNWWGSATGPNNAATNPTGTGDGIDDGLDYSPWWGDDYRTAPLPWNWYVNPSNGSTIAEGVSAAAAGDTLNLTASTFPLAATTPLNKAGLYVRGAGTSSTIVQVPQSTGYAFSITAAGVTLRDIQLQKTDVTGVHNLIFINASDVTIESNLIYGPDPGSPWSVNGIVSRAMEIAGGLSGLLISGNTIHTLRQPAYINPGTVGAVVNNTVAGTRGWVNDGANITFSGNAWGPAPNQGADIALLASVNPLWYPDLIALSLANTNAFLSAQFAGGANGRAIAYVDSAAAPGGDGSQPLPADSIMEGVNGVLPGGTVAVGPGTYREQVYINKNLTLNGVAGRESTFVVPPTAVMNQPFLPSRQERPIIGVDSLGTAVVIDGFTVDGEGAGNTHGYISGVQYFKASGIVRNCTVKRVRSTPFDGSQWGVGILVNHDYPRSYLHAVEVHHTSVFDCGKANIVMNHPGTVGNVHHNTVVGQGPVGPGFAAQVGIQFGLEATGTVAHNTVGGFSYTGPTDGSSSILGFASGGTLEIRDNAIFDGQVAIDLQQSPSLAGACNAAVSNNSTTASVAGTGGVTFYGGVVRSVGTAMMHPRAEADGPRAAPYVTDEDKQPAGRQRLDAAMNVTYRGNTFASSSPGQGVGLYLLAMDTSPLTAAGDSNAFTAFEVGVVTDKDAGASLTSTWRKNRFLGNNYGMLDLTGVLQDARENWWNDATGPRDVKSLPNVPNYNNPGGLGDSVSAYVDYNPWYVDTTFTTLFGYTLGVTTIANGSVTRTPDQAVYPYGTAVTLVAVPDSGFAFLGWSGDTTATADTIEVVMTADRSYTATFTWGVSVSVVGSGAVAKTPDEPAGYAPGTALGLKATPALGWTFAGWTGDTVTVADTLSVVVNGNLSYTATFGTAQYPLTTSVVGSGAVIRSPNQPQYPYGTIVTLTAIPGGSYSFVGWSGDTVTTDNPIQMLMDGPKSVTATFLGDKFTSIPPESLIIKDPARGRFLKPVRRREGSFPNWINFLSETVIQGGFQPHASESDQAGGMVVGLSFMANVGGRWKPIGDSARMHGWVRLGKWRPLRNAGYGYTPIQRTLEDRTGTHTGQPRGLDILTQYYAPRQRVLVGQKTILPPKRHNNPLYAEMVALKLNIAAGQLGKTPSGFGELIFSQPGHAFDGLTVVEISARTDSLMTYWRGRPFAEYDSMHSAIYRINRAFAAPLDTIAWMAGGQLVLNGMISVASVPFLQAGTAPPVVLRRTTDATEPDEPEFDEEEFEENGTPVAAKLLQNYPNPFNPSTTISFVLRAQSLVTITVYDMLGRAVATILQDEDLDEGEQSLEFTAQGLATGVYLYRIDARDIVDETVRSVETRKMILLK